MKGYPHHRKGTSFEHVVGPVLADDRQYCKRCGHLLRFANLGAFTVGMFRYSYIGNIYNRNAPMWSNTPRKGDTVKPCEP